MEISIAFIISAFVAGLITFLAPCTLPLVPGYIGFISGVSSKDLTDPEKGDAARKKIFLNGVSFVLGFSVIFILFGVLLGLVGSQLAGYQATLTRIGGVFVIFFGLFMLGVFRLPFMNVEHRMKMPSFLTIGKPSSSFLVGSAFAVGWTPCVGPVLGSILTLAAVTATAWQGAFLLAIFSLGLAIPFLLVALLFSRATKFITQISKYMKWVSVIGGIILIFIGYLLLTNDLTFLIEKGYELLEFLNYEEFLLKNL